MERDRFKAHFMTAAAAARDFAKNYLREDLPDAMRFRLRLNQSHDRNATSEFKLFPEDRGRVFADLSAEEAIDILWRDGMVPQWIDVSVIGETGVATRLELIACGRFIADEKRLYYVWTPVPPFGVKGPALPGPNHVEGEKFSIYHFSSCHSRADLGRAQAHANEVWSLEVEGEAFDDDVIAHLDFPSVEIVTMNGVAVQGRGFSSLARMKKLRVLRFASTLPTIDVTEIPAHLDEVALRGLYSRVVGTCRAKHLLLAGTHVPEVDKSWSTDDVERLTLAMPTVPPWIRASPSVSWLQIECDASDEEVEAVLATCGEALEDVTLRWQRVTDRILDSLTRFPKLRFIDVVDTRVTNEGLRAFLAKRPGVRSLPQLA